MNPCRVGCAGHPQVFIDGWCGDNVTIHRRNLPVSVWKGNPNHQPGQKPQEEGKSFYYCIHTCSFSPMRVELSQIDYVSTNVDPTSANVLLALEFRCVSGPTPKMTQDATETCKLMINSRKGHLWFPFIPNSIEPFQRLQVFTKLEEVRSSLPAHLCL